MKNEKVVRVLKIILHELENEVTKFQTIENNIHKGKYPTDDDDNWEFLLNECGHIADENKKQNELFLYRI